MAGLLGMSPALARPLLHTAHLVTFIALVVTGLLLYLPDLRAAVVGGYSLFLSRLHSWVGVAFTILPVVIISGFGPQAVLPRPERRTLRTRWQGVHVGVTVIMSTLLAVSGFVLWAKRAAPPAFVDASLVTHDWMTYAVLALLGVHLLEVGISTVVGRLHAAVTAVPERQNR